MYMDKALEIAQRLMPAFRTQTGIPKAMVHLQTCGGLLQPKM